MSSRPARIGIVLFWVILALGGLLVFKKFQEALATEVPPVKGTPSAAAKNTFDEYFPSLPLNGAFIIKSRNGKKLLNFVNYSTCELKLDLGIMQTFGHPNATDNVVLTCLNASAAGGGCLRTADMEQSLAKAVNESVANLTAILPNKSQEKVKQQLYALDLLMQAHAADLEKSLPAVELCPEATDLTKEWFDFSDKLQTDLTKHFPDYDSKILSLASIPNVSKNLSRKLTANQSAMLKNKSMGLVDIDQVNLSFVIPSGELWNLFSSKLLTSNMDEALVSVTFTDKSDPDKTIIPTSPTAKAIGHYMDKLALEAPKDLDAKASSMGSLFSSIKQGIDVTMDMSAKTVPLALLILAGMVRNLRLLLIVLPNLIISIACAILVMYPIVQRVTTGTTAPSLMIAVDLAMSIDYSLFLLTRFGKEIKAGRTVPEAVAIMLSTSGRIVLVSGTTLLLCFLMMLSLPVAFIYSMGISAAVTVFMAVSVSLTFTPVLLLSCPEFFSSSRNFGLSCDGCCCRRERSARDAAIQDEEALPTAPSREEQDALAESEEAAVIKRSCWPSFGTQIQKGAWVVALALVASMVPVAVTSLPKFEHSVGILPMMPTNAGPTHTLIDLQKAFGVGAVFPTELIVVAPPGATDGSVSNKTSTWLKSVCEELNNIATSVNSKMASYSNLPPFTNKTFSGIMILNGQCQTSGSSTFGKWNSGGDPYSATIVQISYQIDPFAAQGLEWIQALRDAADMPSAKKVASWYVQGTGPIQMDASNLTFERLPLMVGLMMSVVFVVMALAFRSIIAPIRAVFCLTWMLVMTYGLAIYCYQDGLLDFLNWSQLGKRESGAMSWLSPSMAGAMMVGLGLDYDIFYSERVVEEWEHGYNEKDAAARALGATANTITAAGIIMVVAFLALLVSETPVLNEIAFLLVVSVIIDCFITTKVIIPCAMALLGKFNFWPRKQPALAVQDLVSLEPPQSLHRTT
jgi:uncharacterized membrane protein YdfJ with MMPL/SSD domain